MRFPLAPNLCRSDYPKRQGVFLILHAYLMTFPRSFETKTKNGGRLVRNVEYNTFGRPKNIPKLYPERIRKADVREIVLFSELDVSLNRDFQKYCAFACYPWNSVRKCEFFMVSFAPVGFFVKHIFSTNFKGFQHHPICLICYLKCVLTIQCHILWFLYLSNLQDIQISQDFTPHIDDHHFCPGEELVIALGIAGWLGQRSCCRVRCRAFAGEPGEAQNLPKLNGWGKCGASYTARDL